MLRKKFEQALRTSVRFNHSLAEFLQHADVKEAWQRVSEEVVPSEGLIASTDVLKDPAVSSLIKGEEPHPLADKLVTRVTQLTPAEETLVTDAEKSAGLQISSLLPCVSMTEETEATQRLKSAESLAASLRALPVMAVRGDTTSSVLMLYDFDGAGEHLVAPRRLACPLRKDHLGLAVTSVLLARSEVPLDDLDFESLGVVPDKADVLLDSLTLSIVIFVILKSSNLDMDDNNY